MDGINSVESSGCKNGGEEENDRITEMPDCILAHILSFLPTEDVVKMVLVPRFRHCWTLIRSLSFSCPQDEEYYYDYDGIFPAFDERVLNLIENVLIRHESSTIDDFSVRFKYNNGLSDEDPDRASKKKTMAKRIRTWVRFAVTKKVKVLELDLVGGSCTLGGCSTYLEVNYKLPDFVLSSDHLTELKLVACAIRPRGHIQLKSLKKLSVREIILSEKIMDEVMNGCPLLEELSLTDCSGLRKLNVTNPNVKRLVLCFYKKPHERLEISCPNVVSLDIDGSLENAHLEDVSSSLVDASLSFNYSLKGALMKYDGVRMLLKKLGNTQSFAPCCFCILVLTIWKLTNQPCPSFSWKFLVLKICLSKWHLPGIFTLLRNSHCLETLTIYVFPGSTDMYLLPSREARWVHAYDFDGGNYWNLEEASFHCLKHHLRTISIYGYVTEPYMIELVEFLLKNAMVLETMVISTKKSPFHGDEIRPDYIPPPMDRFTSEELLEFSQKLLTFPRASTRAVIHFS